MRVLVAMSGGVDSSVAAALLVEEGHEVVGATLKLWGGETESGCCSVSDVEDARRVAQQIGISHHVFDYGEVFEDLVVGPYVDAHAAGSTPNPCIECNRHVKFGRLLERADRLGFDWLATGHHARVVHRVAGGHMLRRGVDAAKDQSYVLAMLTQRELSRVVMPVGEMTKAQVREHAVHLGLRTALKPDSQDVCFVHPGAGRRDFLAGRIPLHQATVIDADSGESVGSVPAVEMVTIGQRRGLGVGFDGKRRYALEVDVAARTVVAGPESLLEESEIELDPSLVTWVHCSPMIGVRVLAQCSAHGRPEPAELTPSGIRLMQPCRPVAPGQTVALYDPEDPDCLIGSGVVARRLSG